MPWTRRQFLETVGRAGGAAAAYEAMTAMGLLRLPSAFAGVPDLPPGNGKRVLILGAGIAGLTAAYELNKKNYAVTILEAKGRPGGRNFTVRRGVVNEEIDGTKQLCRFDEGLYLNAGPGRLPYHHTAVLEYCKVLGVPLEVYVMMSRANLFQTPDAWSGATKTQRQIANDTRGWIADLLAKAIRGKSLDKNLTASDKDALLDLLKVFGDLDASYNYNGSSRSGYTIEPAITPCPEITKPPLQLTDLLKSDFWNERFYQSEEYEWQPTLFEPVGGMDGIVHGFVAHVGNLIRYNREVTGVHNTPEGVRVDHCVAGTKGAASEHEDADWCISTIPLPILKGVDNNFSDEYRAAIAAVNFATTCKVGWQANRRFWELDDQIYGGISYIKHDITQMWYPSYDYFKEKGVLTGAYNYDEAAERMTAMTLEQRLATAMDGAKRLHPRFEEFVPRELGLSVAWKNIPYQRGGWADDWDCPDETYEHLIRPEGHFWVAGDQVSDISGWQEGAIRSALYVLERIAHPELVTALAPREAAPRAARAMTLRTKAIKRRTRGLP
jgi:monoamine oxidase